MEGLGFLYLFTESTDPKVTESLHKKKSGQKVGRKTEKMEKRGMERLSSLPVLLVTALISMVYYTVMFLVIEEWLGMSSASGLFNALSFTWITFMAIVCYGFCIFRDPGKVPQSYMPDVEDNHVPLHEVKRKVYTQLL